MEPPLLAVWYRSCTPTWNLCVTPPWVHSFLRMSDPFSSFSSGLTAWVKFYRQEALQDGGNVTSATRNSIDSYLSLMPASYDSLPNRGFTPTQLKMSEYLLDLSSELLQNTLKDGYITTAQLKNYSAKAVKPLNELIAGKNLLLYLHHKNLTAFHYLHRCCQSSIALVSTTKNNLFEDWIPLTSLKM